MLGIFFFQCFFFAWQMLKALKKRRGEVEASGSPGYDVFPILPNLLPRAGLASMAFDAGKYVGVIAEGGGGTLVVGTRG